MKNITIAFAVAMALMSFGCKKKSAGSGEAIAKMTEFKDRMCKCAEHDAACAQGVSDEMTKWSAEQSKNTAAKMSEQETQKATAISEQLSACMQKAMTPAAPPAGEAPAGGAAGEAPVAGEAAPAPGAAPAGGAAPAPAAEATPEPKK